ncbi:MAG: hypothetical protein K1Y36_07260, partial [Blastocatellia bacterium]|nr:hypothetical protein [Blastocatellia bacterium]
TATTVPTGITVTGITNSNGTITATVTAGCTAAVGNNTVVLTATDTNNATATANLTVTVTANTQPTLTYNAASVARNGSTTVNPATGPTDNGSVSTIVVQSQGTYTGTISVNNGTGAVSISNATPVGVHTITIRATDNCGTTTDATFQLTVTNAAPTITAGAAVTRQQGSAGSTATIATVTDDAGNGTVGVTATTVPTGITVTGITNSNGTITATVTAGCTAAVGNNTVVLTATDTNNANNATATANLTVTVTANTQPTLTYNAASVATGGSTTVNPATGPTDNGSVSTIVVQSQGTYTGTISVNNGTGAVSISNATPVGVHTITIRATDNCGATTDATFQLTVSAATHTVTQFYPIASTTGKTITITGTGFVNGATQVFFGGANLVPATTVTFVNSTSLQVVVPVSSSGAGNINGVVTVRVNGFDVNTSGLPQNASNPGDPTATFPEFVLWGDTTGDGTFATSDVALARGFILFQATPTARQLLAADVIPLNANGSRGNGGALTATDFSFLRAVSFGQATF